MNRITLTFFGLFLTFLAFGQTKTKSPPSWERVKSEMAKAQKGDTITYRSKNTLEWSDFKMSPDLNNEMKFNLELTFGVFVKKANFWTGVITVESFGGIRRDLSWVNPQYKSQQLLDYLQLKYEIAHYFAKKSENEINKNKLNTGLTDEINGIIEKHIIGRDKALNEFDIESDFGNHAEIIDKWNLKLKNKEI